MLLYMSEIPRALFEGGSMLLGAPFLKKYSGTSPHAILVIPGFTTSGRSTRILRNSLTSLGYETHTWKQGINLGVRKEQFDGVTEELDRLFDRYGSKLTLIGQSLGGIYARELAKIRTDKVRQVITLGSPINNADGGGSRVSGLYRLLNPRQLDRRAAAWPPTKWQISEAPPVPTTVIYSKFDGICHWSTCVQTGNLAHVENVPVASSHIGMAVNPLIQRAIAERLP